MKATITCIAVQLIVSGGAISQLKQPEPTVPDELSIKALEKVLPRVEFRAMDLRDALRDVFRQAHLAYAVAPNVQGSVNLSAQNLKAHEAIARVLARTPCRFRFKGGRVEVVHKDDVGSFDGLTDFVTEPGAWVRASTAFNSLTLSANVAGSVDPSLERMVRMPERRYSELTKLRFLCAQLGAELRIDENGYRVLPAPK